MDSAVDDQRGLSPVIGTVMLLTIVIILVSVSAVMVLDLTGEREPQPNVVLDMEDGGVDPIYRLVHESGDTLDGDKVRILGAADEHTLEGEELTTGETSQVVAVKDKINVMYDGDHGTTYRLATFEPDTQVSDPDEGCDWVDEETDGGTDPIKIEGVTVDCDVEIKKGIEVENGGTVIGKTLSDEKGLDGDDATIYGDVYVEEVLNLQDGMITGSATSNAADVKLDNASVEGDATAEKVVEVTGGSSVDGDAESKNKTVKVLSSSVSGSITAGEEVKLDSATVNGDVYIDDNNFDCTDSTINGQECEPYTPKDP